MVQSWLPWSDYPGCTQDRLIVVGDIIRTARTEALDDHRPDKWETNWSLGVRQFERMNGSITWASRDYAWLKVIAGPEGGPVQYVFTVGRHPIRVCRGGADEVAERFQQPCIPELEQQLVLLALDSSTPQGRFLRCRLSGECWGERAAWLASPS